MRNPFLSNQSLKKFIESVKISPEQKNELNSRLEYLDESEREKLFNVLKEVYLLDMEAKEVAERLTRAISV